MRHCRYSLTDGAILEVIDGPDGWMPHDIDGTAILSGVDVHPHRHRIDVQTQQPFEYVPPDPQDGSVWDQVQHRWISLLEQNRPVMAKLSDIEQRQQRALREAVLEIANKVQGLDQAVIDRLAAFENEAAAERANVKKKPQS